MLNMERALKAMKNKYWEAWDLNQRDWRYQNGNYFNDCTTIRDEISGESSAESECYRQGALPPEEEV